MGNKSVSNGRNHHICSAPTDAAEALWTLIFDDGNKQRLRQSEKAMALFERNQNCKQMGRAARGVLWTLRERKTSVCKYIR